MIQNKFRAMLVAAALFLSVFVLNAQCATPESIPYNMDFEDCQTGVSGFPDCWTKIVASNNFPYPTLYQNSICLTFKGGCTAAMPAMAESINMLRVTFDVMVTSTSNALIIGVVNAPNEDELAMMVPIDTITLTQANTFFPVEVHFNSYTDTGRYIVFQHEGSANTRIDNVVVSEIPNCLNPVSVTAQNVTSQSALLTWTEMGTATQWNAILSTTPITNFVGQTTMTMSTPSYMPANLTANTTYYFYVQSICGGDNSEWVGTSFTTLCGISTLPISESFTYNTQPACWDIQQVTGTSTITFVNYGMNPNCSPYSGGAMAQWASYNYNAGRQARLVMPEVSITGVNALDVNFMWFHGNESPEAVSEGVQVQYSYDGTTWTNAPQGLIPRYNNMYDGWTEYDVILPLSGGHSSVNVGFLFTAGGGRNCFLDEVNLSAASGCYTPANLTVSDVEGNSATASWNEVGSANSWQVILSEYPLSDFSGMNPITVTSPNYNITNLNPITTYYFYVRSVCSANSFSDWSLGVSFTTTCGTIMNLPYTESFDNYGVGNAAFPTCWTRPSTSYYQSQITPSAIGISSFDGDNSLIFCTGSNMQTYAITPAIAEDIHQVSASFFLYKENAQLSGTVDVGVMSNASDYATFEQVATFDLSQTETWTFCSVNFDSTVMTGGNRYIAFRHNGVSDFNYYLMDEVSIFQHTDCWPAFHCEVSGVTGNSAHFSWIDVNESAQWQLKISEVPLADPMGYANVLDTTFASNLFNINYLNGNTTYYYYLRPVCSTDETGIWESGSFTTDQCNCYLRIYLHDRFGDGWNQAKIQLKRGSTLLSELTLTEGFEDTVMVYTCEAGPITFTYFGAEDPAYDTEISFEVENQDGMQLYATSGTPTAGVFCTYSPACGVSCNQSPTNVHAVALAGGGAAVSWNAVSEAQSYALYRNGNLVAEYIPTTSYTDPHTDYGDNCYTVAATCIVGESNQSESDCVVGISEFGDIQHVNVYPNPAHSNVTVEADFCFEQISIFNMMGQELGTWSNFGGQKSVDIALNCVPGIYLLKIYSGSESVMVKVVVQ